jgi:hypothetical protein
MTDQPDRIIATIDARNGYDGLRVGLREYWEGIGSTHARLDEIAGVPAGYSGKVMGDAFPKQMGVESLLAILAAMGIKIELVIDYEQRALVSPYWDVGQVMKRRPFRKAKLGEATLARLVPRIAAEMGRKGGSRPMPSEALRYAIRAGSKGGKARKRKMTRLQRKEAARKAAVARWAKSKLRATLMEAAGNKCCNLERNE